MLNKIKRSIKPFLVDAFTRTKERPHYSKLIRETLDYKLAGIEIPISQNGRKLIDLKNKYSGKRAFLIGNGPSLNNCDLTKLKNEFTFGVNAIYLNYDKMNFYPTFYTIEDILIAEDRSDEIIKYNGSQIKFWGNYLNYCLKPDKSTILLNVIVDYNDYKDFPHFSNNAARKVYVGGTVTYLNLQLAYYMGFSEIYLIGFDHKYIIPNDAAISGNKISSQSNDVNHFSPDYCGKGKVWHDPRVDRMEKAFIKAKKHFEDDKRVIRNATVGGFLEVFDRVDYNSLF